MLAAAAILVMVLLGGLAIGVRGGARSPRHLAATAFATCLLVLCTHGYGALVMLRYLAPLPTSRRVCRPAPDVAKITTAASLEYWRKISDASRRFGSAVRTHDRANALERTRCTDLASLRKDLQATAAAREAGRELLDLFDNAGASLESTLLAEGISPSYAAGFAKGVTDQLRARREISGYRSLMETLVAREKYLWFLAERTGTYTWTPDGLRFKTEADADENDKLVASCEALIRKHFKAARSAASPAGSAPRF